MQNNNKKEHDRYTPIFKYYLRDLRSKRGLSVLELSEIAGVSQSYISRLENGNREWPSLKTIISLSEALDVYPSHMFRVILYGSQNNKEECIDIIEFVRSSKISLGGIYVKEKDKKHLIEMLSSSLRFYKSLYGEEDMEEKDEIDR